MNASRHCEATPLCRRLARCPSIVRQRQAKEKLQQALAALKGYKLDAKAADGIRLLEDILTRLASGHYSERDRKSTMYASSYNRRASSHKTWAGHIAAAPLYSKIMSVEEQLQQPKSDENETQPTTEPPPTKKP